MKTFEHNWNNEFFLFHIQFNNINKLDFIATISREYNGAVTKEEEVKVPKDTSSHRIMLSRTHPFEKKITITYPKEVILEAFKIDDRAYFPTETFYVG
jgi:hypothetical protein